ncbi:hypothetical protein AKN87_03010 [Thiopseudomonas alkaliphila]|uniref:PAAR domain-containing protein n=1 Tax=Thiopseudomonas alkaliphila TaxID=1697053 RepID=UPI0006A27CBC|nr:PAAR domain-containing protein [Thiopseudomonas alkaliphila]AKX44184.1 hypothetical protein AKN87_03010 [Thiopseudomonas alkaliphila]
MSQPIIVLGDKTSHGGAVISASSTVTVNGKPAACVGDNVSCPRCKGVYPIISGDPTTLSQGKPIARANDKTACGATLIARQATSTAG